MLKKVVEIVSLGTLIGIIVAKLRGRRINPPALRLLLAIMTAMAYAVGSSMVVLYAGTWLLFLLAGDVARHFGINLSLLLPIQKDTVREVQENMVIENTAAPIAVPALATEASSTAPVQEFKTPLHKLLHSFKIKKG